MNKRRVIIGTICLLVICCLWAVRYFITQKEAIIIPDEVSYQGEKVQIGDNYFFNTSENPAGYSITVGGTKVVSITDFFISKGLEEDYIPAIDENGIPRSEYIYDVEITVTNIDNTDGLICFTDYLLIDKSILLRIDENLMPLSEPALADAEAFRLKKGISKTFHLIFTPDASQIFSDSENLYRRMEQDTFYLCISQFPVRKLIEINPK